MHADVVVDDELEPRQANARVRQLREVERELRVADVHHDLHRNRRQFAALDFGDFRFEQAVVDLAFVAFCARHGNERAFLQQVGRVAAAHHGRHAQFTRDNRRVASTPATVRDDRRGALHHRFPVGVGHVGHQHIAWLHAVHLGRIVNHAHRTRADLLTDCAARNDDLRLTLQLEALLSLARSLALHRFRTRLQDEDLAVAAVLAPFDVHRTLVMLFDDHRILRQFDHVFIRDREAVALLMRDVDRLHAARLARLGEFHLDQLGADRATDDRILALRKRGFVDVELVRIDRALHDGFTQTIARGDEHRVLEAGFRVERKHHASRADVGAHHALHASGQRHFSVSKALVNTIGNGAVVIQRREHVLHAIKHVVDADHVEVAFLLTRERRVRQIFCRGRRADCERQLFRRAVLQRVEARANVSLELRLQRRVDDPLTDFLAGFGKRFHIVNVERLETFGDAFGQVVVMEKVAKCQCRCGETGRHTNPGLRELTDHLAQRRVLAAHNFHIGHSQLLEWNYIRLILCNVNCVSHTSP